MLKFNNGKGATLCDCCGTLIYEGFEENRQYFACDSDVVETVDGHIYCSQECYDSDNCAIGES